MWQRHFCARIGLISPLRTHGTSSTNVIGEGLLRDGPLENLLGAGGGAKYKQKYSHKGKLNEKKLMHAK